MTYRQKRLQVTCKSLYNMELPYCIKCGVLTYDIDMHHINPLTKSFSPSRANNYYDYMKECKKCIPLCKDCHKDIHKIINKIPLNNTRLVTKIWLKEVDLVEW